MVDRLSSLPTELVQLIVERLEYASNVSALARTSRYLSSVATSPYLYPQYAKLCSPAGLDRLVANGNAEALRRLVAHGIDLKKYLDYGRGREHKIRSDRRRSPVEVAASNGFADVLHVIRDVCGPDIVRPGDLNIAINKGDLDVLNPFFDTEVPAGLRENLIEQFIEHALTRGSVAATKCMIDGGFDVNFISNRKLTPLMMAAKGARLDITELLLEAGADPNLNPVRGPLSHYNKTALYHAAISRTEGSSEAVVRCLLNHGALLVDELNDLELGRSANGRYALALLSRPRLNKRTAPARSISPAPTYSRRLKAKETAALAEMVSYGAEDIAQFILSQNDFEERLTSSEKHERGDLLYFAVGIGDEDLLRRLLELGCPAIRSIRWPIMQEAAKRGKSTIVKLLLDKAMEESIHHLGGVYWDAVSSAACTSQMAILAVILDHGGDYVLSLVAKNMQYFGSLFRNEQISSIFVQRGVLKFVVEDNSRDEILHQAMKYGNYELATQIMHHFDLPPSFYLKNQQRSLFELAAEIGPVEGFEKIVSLGVDIDSDDIASHSALFRAADGLQPLIIQSFLDKGFSVNIEKITFRTGSQPVTEPLIVRVAEATIRSQEDGIRSQLTIRLLLERDVDVDAVTSVGETALARAIKQKNINCAKQLLIGGANPFLKTGHSLSPLELAIKGHHCELVEQFLNVAAARGYQFDDFLSLIPSQSIEERLWQRELHPFIQVTENGDTGRIPLIDNVLAESWTDVKQKIEGSDDCLQYPVYWERFFMIKEMKTYYWRTRYPITQDTERIARNTPNS